MGFFKHVFNFSRSSVPPTIQSMLIQLYKDYQTVGLLPHLSQPAFQAAIFQHMDPDELLDLSDAWHEGETGPIRTNLLGQVFGLKTDWRFEPTYVLTRVQQCLEQDQLSLDQEVLGREFVQREGRTWQVTTSALFLSSDNRIVWRYCLLPGLMAGINYLLQLRGNRSYFIQLRTSGDYYVYIYGDQKVEEVMQRSSLFQVLRETDPLAELVRADRTR